MLKFAEKRRHKKNPPDSEESRGNTPVGVDGFEPPTLCL